MGPVRDPDTFWHLASGAAILREGVPRADPFSWSVPGAAWVAHEWGYQVLLAAAWRAWGYRGAVALHGVLCLFLVISALRLARAAGASPAGAGGCALLVVLALFPVLVLRPQVASYGMFAWWLGSLARGRAGWAEGFSLAVLWANLHGSFVLLPGLTAFWALLGSGPRLKLGLLSLAQAVAACLNPVGPGLWRYAAWCLVRPEFRAIREWQSFDFSRPEAWPVLVLVCLFPLVASARRGIPGASVPLAAACMGAALVSARYYPYFVLALIPLLSPFLAVVRGRVLAVASLALVVALTAAVGVRLPAEVVAAEGYPVGGVDYVRAAGLCRVIAEYAWGGYLILRGVPVFIDGRADVYIPTPVWSDYMRFSRGEGAAEVAARWGADACLLEPGSEAARGLVRAGWRVGYSDRACVLLLPPQGGALRGCGLPVRRDPDER